MNILKRIRRYYRTLKLAHRSIETLINIPQISDLESCYKEFDSGILHLPESSTLDMGCGTNPRNPFNAKNVYGIDIRKDELKGIKYADLAVEPIPFEDCKFDYITAYDFLEHVPRILYLPERRFPFIELMNEIYRTLKPGGIFFSHTPILPFSPAFRDPTHVNILTDETFSLYFDDKFTWAKMYGFNGSFKVKYQAIKGVHLVSILQKP